MKKYALLLLLSTVLVGCTSKQSDTEKTTNTTVESSKVENGTFVNFTDGVNSNNEILGDENNFATFSGKVDSGEYVYLVDLESGIIHGVSEVSSDGSFGISCNMQGLDNQKLIFTNDSGINIPKVDDVSKIKNKVYLTFLKNNEVDNNITKDDVSKINLNEELALGDGTQETARLKVVEVTTNQTAFPEHMLNLDNYDTTKMIAVKIEYTNVAMDEPFLPYSNYFQAFDKEGKALVQVNQQNGQDKVSTGRTGVTQLFWELNIDGNQFNELEIDFIPKSKVATFDLTVSH